MPESQEQQTARLDQPDEGLPPELPLGLQPPARIPLPEEREGIATSAQLEASARHVASTASAFDVQSLTLGEISDIEDLSGQAIGALADDELPKGKALTALAYIIKRRDEPAFTFAQASKLTMREVGELTKDIGDTDPKE